MKTFSAFLLGLMAFFLVGALTTYDDFYSSNPNQVTKVPARALTAKGSTDNEIYYLEVDPVTGSLATQTNPTPGVTKENVRNDYSSTGVTTGAWVELIASTSDDIYSFYIFDSSGQTLEIGTGAAASESRLFLVPPGGYSHPVDVFVATGTRISIRAVSADATVGEIDLVGVGL